MAPSKLEEAVRELAKEYGFTHLPDEAVESLLWEHTPYPLGTMEEILKQAREFLAEVQV